MIVIIDIVYPHWIRPWAKDRSSTTFFSVGRSCEHLAGYIYTPRRICRGFPSPTQINLCYVEAIIKWFFCNHVKGKQYSLEALVILYFSWAKTKVLQMELLCRWATLLLRRDTHLAALLARTIKIMVQRNPYWHLVSHRTIHARALFPTGRSPEVLVGKQSVRKLTRRQISTGLL